MTKTEKNKIFDLAMRYDFAAGITEDNPQYEHCYRTFGHYDAMFTLMTELDIVEEYYDYVEKHQDRLERWRNGKFQI